MLYDKYIIYSYSDTHIITFFFLYKILFDKKIDSDRDFGHMPIYNCRVSEPTVSGTKNDIVVHDCIVVRCYTADGFIIIIIIIVRAHPFSWTCSVWRISYARTTGRAIVYAVCIIMDFMTNYIKKKTTIGSYKYVL